MNRQINLGALAEDQHSRVTAYGKGMDLGNNVEISTKRAGKSKTKVVNDSQWHYAWTKYSMVVLWAYPHRQEELSTYRQFILGCSSWVLTSLSTSSLTRLHASTSMGTKICVSPTSANSPSSQTKFSYHMNHEGSAQL